MKWIGQHIWDFISRFRNDVYFEDLSTTTETNILVANSDGKVSKRAMSSLSSGKVTVSDSTANTDFPVVFHDESDGLLDDTGSFVYNPSDQELTLKSVVAGMNPELQLENQYNNSQSPMLTFWNRKSTDSSVAGVNEDLCGAIYFYGMDSVSAPYAYATLKSYVQDITNGQEKGRLELQVSANSGLILTKTATTSEVDATIGKGAASTTTIAGTLTMGSTAFVNNSGVVQVATQGTIDHDSLANFVAAEHVAWGNGGTGTIHPSNIPTLNQDTTGTAATVTGAAQTNVTSLGTLTNLNVDNININGDTITASADLSIVATGNDITIDTDNLVIESATDGRPLVELKSTTNSSKGSVLQFTSDKGAAGADDDGIGSIIFVGDDDHPAQQQTNYAKIIGRISDASNTDEAGKLEFQVAESDGTTTTLTTGLLIEGEHATDGEVDVTIGAGAASTTTVSGNLAARETTVTNLITSGNIELGHATDTTITRSAAGKVTIQGNEIQTTNVHHHFLNAGFFLNFPYSRYIPLQGSLNEQNTATSSPEYVNFTWPYDGYVKTMWLRSETDMGNTELALYKGASGATVVTALGAVTESVSASNAVEFDFTSVTNSYSQGDTMAVRIDPTDDPDGGQNITIELIFDLTT